ncbi:hypothetical protein ACFX2J_044075 [Malus domestica]
MKFYISTTGIKRLTISSAGAGKGSPSTAATRRISVRTVRQIEGEGNCGFNTLASVLGSSGMKNMLKLRFRISLGGSMQGWPWEYWI